MLWFEPGAGAFIPAMVVVTLTEFINAASYIAHMALLGDIAFPLLALFGYQLGADNSDSANFGLILVYIIVPAVTSIAAVMILWNFPIDSRRDGIIRRRLEQLASRAATR